MKILWILLSSWVLAQPALGLMIGDTSLPDLFGADAVVQVERENIELDIKVRPGNKIVGDFSESTRVMHFRAARVLRGENIPEIIDLPLQFGHFPRNAPSYLVFLDRAADGGWTLRSQGGGSMIGIGGGKQFEPADLATGRSLAHALTEALSGEPDDDSAAFLAGLLSDVSLKDLEGTWKLMKEMKTPATPLKFARATFGFRMIGLKALDSISDEEIAEFIVPYPDFSCKGMLSESLRRILCEGANQRSAERLFQFALACKNDAEFQSELVRAAAPYLGEKQVPDLLRLLSEAEAVEKLKSYKGINSTPER